MKQLKIYKMNEFDWWADYSEEEAIKNYLSEMLLDEDEIDEVEEVTGGDLDKLLFAKDVEGENITFRERLEFLNEDRNEPQLFASTEY